MVASNPRTIANRSGFTLVELLTVIVIIGILAGLVTAAAVHAVGAARQFTITNEIAQLGMALEQYKIRFGEYPPDFAGIEDPGLVIGPRARSAVVNHFKRAFPRYRLGVHSGTSTDTITQWEKLAADLNACGVNINLLGPENALVFWLGGPPSGGSTKVNGFSANPANPFSTGGSRLDPLFEFDESRVIPLNGVYVYVPPYVRHPDGGNTVTPPYVYFRAYRLDPDDDDPYLPSEANFALLGAGMCVPYASYYDHDTDDTRWINPKTYQIISSGRDGLYSTLDPLKLQYSRHLRDSNDTNNITIQEDDNLTNFSTGRLEDMVE